MNIHRQDNLTIYNADCMEIMSRYEDNYFDLAVDTVTDASYIYSS